MSKKFRHITANVILLSLLGLSCLDTAWSSPLPDEESNWKCAIATMHKKKSVLGDCYSYQQCQWRGIGDYDMEVIGCPPGKIFDEGINECVNEKVLAFNFDRTRCEPLKTPGKGLQPQNSSETAQPSATATAPKEAEPLAQTPTAANNKTSKRKKKPMSMAEMAAFSEQSMSDIGTAKISAGLDSPVKPEGSPEPSPDGKQAEGAPGEEASSNMVGRSMHMAPIPPIQPMDGNPEPVKRSRLRVPEIGNIKQPEFFKPFDNFPTTTRIPGKRKPRVLSHEALVKPNVATKKYIG